MSVEGPEDPGFPDGARAAEPGSTGVVTITTSDARGDGHSEDGVRVPGVFPGERVRIRIAARGRRASHAVALEVLEPHPRRRPSPCPRHRATGFTTGRTPSPDPSVGRCDGCALLELDESAQRELKARRVRELGIPIDRVVPSPRALGYRWSAKRVVGGTPGALVFGSRERRSDAIASMAGCLVDHPRIVAALAQLREIASARRVAPWDRDEDAGLRYVWAKTNGAQVGLTLIGGPSLAPVAREIAPHLRHASFVAVAVQTDPGNAIRGDAPRIVHGASFGLSTPTGSVPITPLGFLQPNPEAIASAYDALVRGPSGGRIPGRRAWDLYAGAGAITHRLRALGYDVEPCEAYPEAAAALGARAEDVARFVAARCDIATRRPDLIVANPPRAGLRDAAARIDDVDCEHVHLMSCNPDSLARDLRALTRFEIVAARAFDPLPQTPHVEVVVWLRSRHRVASAGR